MADHYVDVVNENDEVIGKELKSRKPELGFISRVVAVMLRDSDNNFIVCKRAAHKEIFADKYDLAACGNVNLGEDYTQAAIRELREELNIECPLEMLDQFYQEFEHKGDKLKFFCGVFLGHTDEEPKLNHELVSFKRMSFEELEQEMENNPDKFCPGFINDFDQVRTKLK
ncbi:NUDIX domain-containing protein [Candidatus Woesearchaeota archaeon]|nr:NUDIX domain-containing protein [Candidatus Woesearchaeota archaeon]